MLRIDSATPRQCTGAFSLRATGAEARDATRATPPSSLKVLGPGLRPDQEVILAL